MRGVIGVVIVGFTIADRMRAEACGSSSVSLCDKQHPCPAEARQTPHDYYQPIGPDY
ncbi:hypothetical protein [Pantoea agglomerans]|uniref:hypothetical protein n=1 Tax=Enterobacter agglomerans TaxID=549 RepID=UPI00311DB29D